MADPSAAPLPDGDAQTPQHDAAAVTNGTTNGNVDVEMKEEMPADATPLPQTTAATPTAGIAAPPPTAADTPGDATPPAIASTSTPPPTTAGAAAPLPAMAPRTGSPRPAGASTPNAQQQQQQRQELPTQPNPHGSATRVYLNQNVTPHLLEGMKRVALLEPEKPLKWLSDFLAEKSREHERD
ncbi:putative compass complex subunit protein [Neofusicoccum parvum]|uniref:Putative compass complex subunit protein n=1 Tax=Botryosphaeria parva (strain UCR-NP2) TaxID=1287680 RepID=R1GFZ3_BOTPV|nr:putative compass complex subunit protein [Neofusicoccum parvum UCRNP2]GME54853.1 putative compass complex subunit protein [Neofusicoccum parvum]